MTRYCGFCEIYVGDDPTGATPTHCPDCDEETWFSKDEYDCSRWEQQQEELQNADNWPLDLLEQQRRAWAQKKGKPYP